jgi:hypothetical protein
MERAAKEKAMEESKKGMDSENAYGGESLSKPESRKEQSRKRASSQSNSNRKMIGKLKTEPISAA